MNLLVALTLAVPAAGLSDATNDSDYLDDIKPILQSRCFACHGALKQESGLRLDTASSILKGGDSGPAIVAGKSADSLLIEAVTGDLADWRMPPEGEALSREQIESLKKWIAAGAPHPKHEEPEHDPRQHWAFQQPQRHATPNVQKTEWGRNDVDNFVAAMHEQHGLTPVPGAPKHILLRRIYIDLIGLPPSRAQLHEFLADDSADAYEKVVDRLLASPAYGERWGRHWMDVWRYSDWYGRRVRGELRNSQRHIWRWRDWIVESLNADKGYDRMVIEMLAGDEFAPDDPDTLRATGYLARNYNRTRNRWIEDTVEFTTASFLGLTFRCTRCHDHKYDPFTQKDYYSLRAIFDPYNVRTDQLPGQPDILQDGLPRVYDSNLSIVTYLLPTGDPQRPDKTLPMDPGVPALLGNESFHVEPVALPAQAYYPGLQPHIQEMELTRLRTALRQVRVELDNLASNAESATRTLAEKRVEAAAAALRSLRARIIADRERFQVAHSTRTEQSQLEAMQAENELIRLQTELQFLEAKHELDDIQAKTTNGQNAAAVAAATKKLSAAEKALKEINANDSQSKSTYSTIGSKYPAQSTGRRLAFARWLVHRDNPLAARVAVNHMWMRHFGRPLVESVADFGRNGKQPINQPLLDTLAVQFMESGWKMKTIHRAMVTSQTYRMQSAAVSKDHPNRKLDQQNRYFWRMNPKQMEAEVVRDSLLHIAGRLDPEMAGADLEPKDGESLPRRSIYFRHAADGQMTFLEVFDVANPNSCYRRHERTVPHQALAMVNSNLTHALSEELAKKTSVENDSDFIERAFETILCRSSSSKEHEACLRFLSREVAAQTDDSTIKTAPSLRARQSLIHVLMNHNDFVTIH